LASIRQLPEVEAAIDQFPSISTLDNLKRASDVFASFDKGGREHLAVQAMLAECQQRRLVLPKRDRRLNRRKKPKPKPLAMDLLY
jgi:hypothetical protein